MKTVGAFLNGENTEKRLIVDVDGVRTPLDNPYCTVVVDGGMRWLPRLRRLSGRVFWVGDFDSTADLSGFSFSSDIVRHVLSPEKNLSDFAAAVDSLLAELAEDEPVLFDVVGGLGGRRDHEVINLAEAGRVAAKRPATFVFSSSVVVTSQAISVFLPVGTVFSLMVSQYGRSSGCVLLDGAKYSGVIELTRPSHGLSNVMISESLRIEPGSGTEPIYLLISD